MLHLKTLSGISFKGGRPDWRSTPLQFGPMIRLRQGLDLVASDVEVPELGARAQARRKLDELVVEDVQLLKVDQVAYSIWQL